MRRREFITLIGGAAAACPLAARAQKQAMPVIGYVSAGTPDIFASRVRAFREGLSEEGYVEGRNITVDYHWTGFKYEELKTAATDLVGRKVALIVADGPAVYRARDATSTIPIIFWTTRDPVEAGWTASLSRPSGNLTGVTSLGSEMGAKRLELLHQVVHGAQIFALLINPLSSSVAEYQSKGVQTAADSLGVALHVLHASTDGELDQAFAKVRELRPTGLVISPDVFFLSRVERIAGQALREAIPAIYQYREFTAAGGLMSYGTNVVSLYKIIGSYAGRILKGEKTADLPVQQVTRVELIINLKTAKTLGLEVPPVLVARADEVIE
jgi:putative tryptophan/tyrosine transport system substrate-binding protein